MGSDQGNKAGTSPIASLRVHGSIVFTHIMQTGTKIVGLVHYRAKASRAGSRELLCFGIFVTLLEKFLKTEDQMQHVIAGASGPSVMRDIQ